MLALSERFESVKSVNMFCMTVVDRVSFAPVNGMVAGQDCDFLHDSEESWMARYSGPGTCKRAGHSEGFGIGQLPAWSNVEY